MRLYRKNTGFSWISLNNKNIILIFFAVNLPAALFIYMLENGNMTTPPEQAALKFIILIAYSVFTAFILYLFNRRTKINTAPGLKDNDDTESVYSLFAENSDELLWQMDLNSGIISFIGPSAEQANAHSTEEARSRNILEFLTGKYQQTLQQELAERISGFDGGDEAQKVRISEIEAVYTDGTSAAAEIKTILIKNKNSKISGLIGISRNISKAREAEQKYAEIQEQIEAVYNATDDLIWTVDPENFGLKNYNNRFRDYFLKKRGIVINAGMTPAELVHSEYIGFWHQIYNNALINGSFITEYTTISESHSLLLTLNTLRQGERVFGISVTGRNIAAQKALEKIRLESEKKYRDIFRIFPYPALIFKLFSGIYLEINSEFELISGYSRDDLIGKSDYALNLWSEPEKRNSLMSQLKSNGYFKEQILGMHRKDGTEINCAISASVIETEGGPLVLMVLKKITEIENVIQLLSYK